MSRRRRTTEPAAVELVEEAVHLLRRAPAASLVVYYAGAVPFVLGLLFFWAYTTWFMPSGATVAWGALGLTVLFIVMKALQAEFCEHLLAIRLGATIPAWSWRRMGRLGLAQLEIQPWALLGLGIAALTAVPFGWVYAYGQIVTVLGDDERLHRVAVEQAKRWPGENHLGLLLIGAVALGLWVNILVVFIAVPALANRLLGIENVFGLSGWSVANTTFLASVAAVTWLAVDPLVKAFYTLWVFRGRSRRTGDDIRVEFQLARRTRRLAGAAVILLFVLFGSPIGSTLRATEPPPAIQPEQLDPAIDRVLSGPDFTWRLRPLPGASNESKDGPVAHFFRQGASIVKNMLRATAHAIGDFVRWLGRHLRPERANAAPMDGAGAATTMAAVQVFLYVFIGVIVLLVLWLAWAVWRQARRSTIPIIAAQPLTVATPDLRDENVHATQLPTDGWLALAREQAARGEWRLAWRALYLAMLARFAAEGLISLARFKTNLDYEREVRRRALSQVEVVARFSARRRGFEDVWYGSVVPGEAEVRDWMAELERLAPR